VQIHIGEEGRYLRFGISGLGWMPDRSETERRSKLMELILDANFTAKLIEFGVDDNDGEINMEIAFPVSDQEFDPALFHRAMASLVHGIREYVPKIDAICADGRAFDTKASDSGLEDDLQQLLDSLDLDNVVPDDEEAGDADATDEAPEADGPADAQPASEPEQPPTTEPGSPASARRSRRTKRPTDAGD
jgi:hypothetical protein